MEFGRPEPHLAPARCMLGGGLRVVAPPVRLEHNWLMWPTWYKASHAPGFTLLGLPTFTEEVTGTLSGPRHPPRSRKRRAFSEMLRQRHKSRDGHIRPSNRNNFGSTEVTSVRPNSLRFNRDNFG